MIPPDVALVMVLAATLFMGVAIAGFIVFYRFLNIEKERGKRFRAIHGNKSERKPKDQ